MSVDDPVTELRAELAKMKEELALLRAEVAAQPPIGSTIREASTCPSCRGTSFIFAKKVLDRDQGGRRALAVKQDSWWRDRPIGIFQVYICRGCGHVEWLVKDPAELEPDQDLELLERTQREKAPYR